MYFELEVELEPDGTEEDLQAIASLLQAQWGLTPEPRSKFERALALLDDDPPTGSLLAPWERTVCEDIAGHGGSHARRAQALLALDEHHTQVQAGALAHLSERSVRHCLAAFRRDRLGIFPSHAVSEATAHLAAAVVGELQAGPTAAQNTRMHEAPAPSGDEAGASVLAQGSEAPAAPAGPPKKPTLTLDDTMAEAARLTLRYHFLTMLYHEPGTRRGEDNESLHDMRVAVRRMYLAARLLELQGLTASFPAAWAGFHRPEMRDRISRSIAGMW